MLLQGQVLREVLHFFWKKDYKSRDAPYHHVMLWIKVAPIIKDGTDIVTCWIPDEKASPILHCLVAKFQMHKCSSYCKCEKKCGSTYITQCEFERW